MGVSFMMDIIPGNTVIRARCTWGTHSKYQSLVKGPPQQCKYLPPFCVIWQVSCSVCTMEWPPWLGMFALKKHTYTHTHIPCSNINLLNCKLLTNYTTSDRCFRMRKWTTDQKRKTKPPLPSECHREYYRRWHNRPKPGREDPTVCVFIVPFGWSPSVFPNTFVHTGHLAPILSTDCLRQSLQKTWPQGSFCLLVKSSMQMGHLSSSLVPSPSAMVTKLEKNKTSKKFVCCIVC